MAKDLPKELKRVNTAGGGRKAQPTYGRNHGQAVDPAAQSQSW